MDGRIRPRAHSDALAKAQQAVPRRSDRVDLIVLLGDGTEHGSTARSRYPGSAWVELRYSSRDDDAAAVSLRRVFDVTRRCALIAVRRRGDAGLKAARAAASGAALGLTASDSLRVFLLELLADTPQLLSMLLTKAASGHRRPGTPVTRSTTHTTMKGTRGLPDASRRRQKPPNVAISSYTVPVS